MIFFFYWGVVKWQDTGLWHPHPKVRILPPQPSSGADMIYQEKELKNG